MWLDCLLMDYEVLTLDCWCWYKCSTKKQINTKLYFVFWEFLYSCTSEEPKSFGLFRFSKHRRFSEQWDNMILIAFFKIQTQIDYLGVSMANMSFLSSCLRGVYLPCVVLVYLRPLKKWGRAISLLETEFPRHALTTASCLGGMLAAKTWFISTSRVTFKWQWRIYFTVGKATCSHCCPSHNQGWSGLKVLFAVLEPHRWAWGR